VGVISFTAWFLKRDVWLNVERLFALCGIRSKSPEVCYLFEMATLP
jgi:hypothetical protein